MVDKYSWYRPILIVTVMGRVGIAVVVVLTPLKAKLWTGVLPDTLHWLLLLGDKNFFSAK